MAPAVSAECTLNSEVVGAVWRTCGRSGRGRRRAKPGFSWKADRPYVGQAPAAVAVEGGAESALSILGCQREQRHAGYEFHIVGRAENLEERPPLDRKHDVGAGEEPAAEQRVSEIGARFRQIGNSEAVRGRRDTETAELGEDEPHPVASFPTGVQLRQGVTDDVFLRGDEARSRSDGTVMPAYPGWE